MILSGDFVAHTNKSKLSINSKWHQLLAHDLNIHTTKIQENMMQHVGQICYNNTCNLYNCRTMAKCCNMWKTNDPKISFHKGGTNDAILTPKKYKHDYKHNHDNCKLPSCNLQLQKPNKRHKKPKDSKKALRQTCRLQTSRKHEFWIEKQEVQRINLFLSSNNKLHHDYNTWIPNFVTHYYLQAPTLESMTITFKIHILMNLWALRTIFALNLCTHCKF